MSKKEEFINYVKALMDASPDIIPSDGAKFYFEALINKPTVEKPMFTENGKMVLKYMQDNSNIELWKAKDIAEGLFISSRTVSGAMRKLVTDEFVEKVGADPVVYTLTEKGKNIEIV